MAYGIQFYHQGMTELNQEVLILIAKKDTPEASPTVPFECEDDIEMSDDSDEGTIIARQLNFTIRAEDWLPELEWDTFLADNYDEWWVIMYIDQHAVFEGFIVPEEGNRPLLDKPYPIVITATNGLKLLKDVPLSNLNGTAFKGKFTLIEYISAALSKTLLNNISDEDGIPLRIYCNVIHSGMVSRVVNPIRDMYQQVKLDFRTFQTAPTTAMNAYDALVAILSRHSRLFYWNGRWVIEWIGDHQYTPPEGRWYTEYDASGQPLNGQEDEEGYAQVGKAQLIYPINENPFQSSSFAIKSAKTRFEYDIWPEIPLNNKFERGTLYDEGQMNDIYDQDGDGNITENVGTFKRFTIEDWTYGLNTGPTSNANLPILAPTAALAFRRSIYNIYKIELTRELQLNATGDPFTSEKWLQSEGIPVRTGDKIKIDFNFRTTTDMSGGSGTSINTTINTARIYIMGTGTNKMSLQWDASMQFGKWVATNGGAVQKAIIVNYSGSDDTSKYTSVSVESLPIPATGTMYIVLGSSLSGQTAYYSGFNLEYIPYVAGGYIPVKGDYWLHGQNKNILDVDDELVKISDATIAPVKGAMLNTIDQLLTPTWRRGDTDESRHFKELVNLARYNLRYRRFWAVEGEFNSIEYEPITDPLNKQPLSYHKNYLFPDFPSPRLFTLVTPLQQNVSRGTIQATFEEVGNPANFTQEAVTTREALINKIIARINATTPIEWSANGQTPALGTPGYPPVAFTGFLGSTDLSVWVPLTATPTFSADANGAGNSPSWIQISQSVGTLKWVVTQVGSDIAVGNRFTITIFGVAITIEVENVQKFADGTQEGDFQEFNYIF